MTAPALAVTVGDPVGIGPEITATVLAEFAGRDDQHGIAVADLAVMKRAVDILGLDVELRSNQFRLNSIPRDDTGSQRCCFSSFCRL